MTPKTVGPAFSPEQWPYARFEDTTGGYELSYAEYDRELEMVVDHSVPLDRHKLAALCLFGQPFGFTQEEAEFLAAWADDPGDDVTPFGHALFQSLAEKVKALLPPPPSL